MALICSMAAASIAALAGAVPALAADAAAINPVQTHPANSAAQVQPQGAYHDFDVPESMVEAEFAQIWQQLTQEAKGETDPEAALAEIEAEKDDYRQIAVRRVRLGLVVAGSALRRAG